MWQCKILSENVVSSSKSLSICGILEGNSLMSGGNEIQCILDQCSVLNLWW